MMVRQMKHTLSLSLQDAGVGEKQLFLHQVCQVPRAVHGSFREPFCFEIVQGAKQQEQSLVIFFTSICERQKVTFPFFFLH